METLLKFISKTDDWFSFEDCLVNTALNENELKKKLEVLKDNFTIIQAGSMYRRYNY